MVGVTGNQDFLLAPHVSTVGLRALFEDVLATR